MPAFLRTTASLLHRTRIVLLTGGLFCLFLFVAVGSYAARAQTTSVEPVRSTHAVAALPVIAQSGQPMTPEELRETIMMTMEAIDRRKVAAQPSSIPWPPILLVVGLVTTIIGAFIQRTLNGIEKAQAETNQKVTENGVATTKQLAEMSKELKKVEHDHVTDAHNMAMEAQSLSNTVNQVKEHVGRVETQVHEVRDELHELRSRLHPA